MPRSFRDSDEHAVVGGWDACYVRVFGGEDPIDYYAGAVRDGELNMERSFEEVLGTSYPQVIERLVPTGVSFGFTGQFLELGSPQIMNWLCGGLISDADSLIPIGAACNAQVKHGFLMSRVFCNETDREIQAYFWKAQVSGALAIGANASEVGFQAEIRAFSDANNDYGGSSSAPLGTIYIPASTTSMVQAELAHRLGIDPDP